MVRTITEQERLDIMDLTTERGGGILFRNATSMCFASMDRLRTKGNAEEFLVKNARKYLKKPETQALLADIRARKAQNKTPAAENSGSD